MKITRSQLRKLIKESAKEFMKDFEEELAATKDRPLGTFRGDNYPAAHDEEYLFKGKPRQSDSLPVGRAAYLVKKLWNKYVDRSWVDSLIKIHWADSLSSFIDSSIVNKDELSCATYTVEEFNSLSGTSWVSAKIGLVLEGYTTFLSPGTSNPGFYRFMAKVPGYIESKKSSGISRLPLTFGSGLTPDALSMMEEGGLLYNQESWDKIRSQDPSGLVESYVDNWKISQIIFSSQEDYENNLEEYENFIEKAKQKKLISTKYKEPIIL